MGARVLGKDPETGVWAVAWHGPLTLREAALARCVVRRCLAHRPVAIVVDLSGMSGIDRAGLALLRAWQRDADRAGVRLAYVAAGDLAALVRTRGPDAMHVESTVARAWRWVLDRLW